MTKRELYEHLTYDDLRLCSVMMVLEGAHWAYQFRESNFIFAGSLESAN